MVRRGSKVAPAGDVLRAVRDGLRSGLSLSAAIERAADRRDGAMLGGVMSHMRHGSSVADALERCAAAARDEDASMALIVLAAHARAGGDPAPAVASLEARIRTRERASREARTLTTQARMSARALLVLTPGFLLLLLLLDPSGTWRAVTSVRSGVAVAAGLALEVLGAVWITRIVDAPLRPEPADPRGARLSALPLLRVVPALFARGRRRDAAAAHVAFASELVALLVGAGMSPSRALEHAAPVAPGPFGDGLRAALASVHAGTPRAVALDVAMSASAPEAARFVEAFSSADALGVPLAESMRALADDLMDVRAASLAEAVRGASVKVLLPLGLLILPAFVLACLVPLFLGGLQGIRL